MKTDYSELCGKEVVYKYTDTKVLGVVVAALYDKGITVANKNDPNDFLVCLNREIHYKNAQKN